MFISGPDILVDSDRLAFLSDLLCGAEGLYILTLLIDFTCRRIRTEGVNCTFVSADLTDSYICFARVNKI